jgi:hypothetical protein
MKERAAPRSGSFRLDRQQPHQAFVKTEMSNGLSLKML